jgi:DNA helicase-2/ATP-dependent DNA helicase PcrA
MNTRTKKILGPPGTGKTTRLIAIMQEHIDKGVEPQKVCYVSFTKKAANEARERVIEKFGFSEEVLPFFRTLHSLAFHFHSMEKKNVMGFSNYIDICKLMGLSISSVRVTEDSFASAYTTKGDRMFFLENLARASKKSLNQVWQNYLNDDIDIKELELLKTTIEDYKKIHDKVDFTDMIEYFVKVGSAPDIDVLIVDEAQDLSALQWDMVRILANKANYCYVAGDDDQAIYTWAGADVVQFQDLPAHDTEVLHQSYRIPEKVFDIAMSIITKVRQRNYKNYLPTPYQGSVMMINNLSELDLAHGTWLLLARNIFSLTEYSKHCVDRGYLFECKHMPVVDAEVAPAIITWERLRKLEIVTVEEAIKVYDYMKTKIKVKWGFKKKLMVLHGSEKITIERLHKDFGLITDEPWHMAMGLIDRDTVEYYKAALLRGEKMLGEPRIKISTIHGVKGGEADNVVIIPDMSLRTYDEAQRNPDEEARVWYVGVTRTKKNLYWMQPRTPYFYQL